VGTSIQQLPDTSRNRSIGYCEMSVLAPASSITDIGVVRGRLTPEAGAALLRAIDAAGEKLYEHRRGERDAADDDSTAEQRRADALGLVAESALAGGLDPGTRGDRYQVVVTSTPRRCRRGASAVRRRSKTDDAFPRKRPGGWPATPRRS
jgi:hypothetical protein